MHERIIEHERNIRLSRTQTSAVSEHANKTGHYPLWDKVKVIRPSFLGGVPSYFEAPWYPHLYFYRKSNT